MPVIGFMGGDDDIVIVLAIAEVVTGQVLSLDAKIKFWVMEIDGLVIGIVDGKVDANGIAMMENWSFVK